MYNPRSPSNLLTPKSYSFVFPNLVGSSYEYSWQLSGSWQLSNTSGGQPLGTATTDLIITKKRKKITWVPWVRPREGHVMFSEDWKCHQLSPTWSEISNDRNRSVELSENSCTSFPSLWLWMLLSFLLSHFLHVIISFITLSNHSANLGKNVW